MRVLLFAVFAAALSLASCFSLDPFLFNPEEKNSYALDAFDGPRECSTFVEKADPLPQELIHDDIRIRSGSETLAAVLLHDSAVCTPHDTLILYFHGKGRNIDYYWPRTRLLYAVGYDSTTGEYRYPVLVIDYRAYGLSSGTITEKGLYTDGFAALRYVREDLGNPYVVVYTHSLGSLVGCKVTSEDTVGQIKKLIMEAPIGSVQSIIADGAYLDLPAAFVSTYTGNNAKRIKNVEVPYLWIGGTEDETLPIETHGYPIWDNYQGPRGCKVIVKGGTHGETPTDMGYDRYLACVRSFIQGKSHPLCEVK
jgi:hypothetical protein